MNGKRDSPTGRGSLFDRSENDQTGRNSNISELISVGKGNVELGNGVVKIAEGKYLVLELSEEKGPCPDNMCQLKAEINIRILGSINDPSSYEIIRTDKFTLAISKAVWHAIDKGRQGISIRKGRFGNLSVKGFSLTY
ncbi:hypothetical protein Mia14_0880 [Candidatus Mancarchaeum acidiphilum]|uniref:Uncharacterized protein n=1 Tax=Candidatus Mancarchaeum acidiphilum TaxID=1920749 RepID=A0A218NNX1_9ARCH|nr:hypothetical protein [Candidatus Mancarchaeum acidiphilum]ASI14161.1 hypothetical protein Mia14_0880 [Candidatus Mancarchaeum acidiphilum]